MTTNLEYENAHAAIEGFKTGVYTDLSSAAVAHGVDIKLVNIMLGNEETMTEDVFVDNATRMSRTSICNSCDQLLAGSGGTCNQCACPIAIITNMKFKSCPLEKW